MADTPIPIFDGHNDVLLRLRKGGPGSERSFLERNETGHLDLPRARDGGFAGGIFAIFIRNPQAPDLERQVVRTADGYEIPLPPLLEASVPDLFRELSLAMEADPPDWRGYFMASAFVAEVIKAAGSP